ncbi:hypothetical protein QBC45DRAFT_66424 [Copromyces sp. CBS 386.78]|nr:hypothetical protein QBC45DRAFT_66424 [Copromyces sp. CBS 386.78]
MRSLAQLALITLASAAAISPGAFSPRADSPYPSPNNRGIQDHSAFKTQPSLNLTSTSSSPSDNLTKRRTNSGIYTPLLPPNHQPTFCPYDTVNQPQPLLSYDPTTAPLASDCGYIIDLINDTKKQGYWTFSMTDLLDGFTLINYQSCAFRLVLDNERQEILGGGGGGGGNGKKDGEKVEQLFKFGVEDLRFYLGSWLEKQRHGRLGAVGTVDCWAEGVENMKKDRKGTRTGVVGVKWIVMNTEA